MIQLASIRLRDLPLGAWIRRTITGVALAAAAGQAHADALAPQLAPDPVPSVRILTGTLISPTDALNSVYNPAGTGHTPPITGQRAPEIKDLAQSLSRPGSPPNRVGDLDQIYGYVRNRIDTEFLFGSHKGALGAFLDRAGTPFDQATLMVELAKEWGFDARYELGKVTLNQDQVYAWTGIKKAKPACDFFATAGIPATFNTCDPASEAFTVQFLHVWVRVYLPGASTPLFFDPSLKTYEHRAGINVRGDMGFAAGAAAANAAPATANGTQTAVVSGQANRDFTYQANYNQQGLKDLLQGYSTTLLAKLQTPAMQNAAMVDVVGGPVLTPAVKPDGGWVQAEPSNYIPVAEWAEIPDVYRAKLTIAGDRPDPVYHTSWSPLFTVPLFADDVYGRRLQLQARQKFIPRGPAGTPYRPYSYYPRLVLDPALRNADGTNGRELAAPDSEFLEPNLLWIRLRMTVDHPFAAPKAGSTVNGTFGDEVVDKRVNFVHPATIIHGWGHTGSAMGAQWAREQEDDTPTLVTQSTIAATPDTPSAAPEGPSGDVTRARAGAAWLAEFSQAAELHARLAGGRFVHHHTVGVVSADIMPVERSTIDADSGYGTVGFSAVDEVSVADLETDFGLVSYDSDAVARRGGVLAIASTASTLEGLVFEEGSDSADSPSTARRLAWGDKPPACTTPVAQHQCETPDATPRRMFAFPSDSTTDPAVLDEQIFQMLVTENQVSGPRPVFQEQDAISDYNAGMYRIVLAAAITRYARAGFQITASAEALLGPGSRHGSEIITGDNAVFNYFNGTWLSLPPERGRAASLQAGGALIATKYAGDEPVEVAHVLTRFDGEYKGGGGPAAAQAQAFDPKKAADILKDKFVDRSSALGVDLRKGTAGYQSPVLDSVGQGEFPYRLERSVAMRGEGPSLCDKSHDSRCGFVTNWTGSVQPSSSALEAMGQSRPEASAATLTAFVAMQDIWRAAPSTNRDVIGSFAANWWADTVGANVMTVQHGAEAAQFVRLPDGLATKTFIPATGGASRVIVTGERFKRRPQITVNPYIGERQKEGVSRAWRYENLNITVRGEGRDDRTYAYWYVPGEGANHVTDTGTWGFQLDHWTFPRGVQLTLQYAARPADFSQAAALSGYYIRPTAVVSNAGPTLSLPPLAAQTYDGVVFGFTATDAMSNPVKATFSAPGLGAPRPWPARLTAAYDQESATVPQVAYTYTPMGHVAEARDANQVTNPALAPHRFFIAEDYRGERQDPLGYRYAVEWLPGGGLAVGAAKASAFTRNIDERGFVGRELDFVTTATMDGRGRVIERVYPEGNKSQFEYDAAGHVTKFSHFPKATSDEKNQLPLVVRATWDPTWNKIGELFDANNNRTAFTYYAAGSAGAGELHTVELPPVTGGTPVYSFTYTPLGQVLQTTDPSGLRTDFGYEPSGSNHFLVSTSVDANHLALTTTFTNNAKGDPEIIDGPRNDVSDLTRVIYDGMRRKLIDVAADAGVGAWAGKPVASRTFYDAGGRVTSTAQGYMTGLTAADFHPVISATFQLDAAGNKVMETTPAGVTQFSYDGLNRLVCTAKRMAATNADACKRATSGSGAPQDQISANFYDPTGQLSETRIGVNRGAGGELTGVSFVRYEYTPNGQRGAVLDGLTNRTQLIYDGFDRLKVQYFPSKARSADAYDTTDHEDYRYDANGNRTKLYKRDGTEFTFTYDSNNRMTAKVVKNSPGLSTTYAYDLAGRLIYSTYPGLGVVYTRDSAGRVIGETTNGRLVGIDLDEAGNRKRLTWPGGTKMVDYEYDAANRLTRIREPGATDVGVLATYEYKDDLGRRTKLVRGNGGSATYGYDTAGRLKDLGQAGAGTNPRAMLQSIEYSPANQITKLTQTNSDYAWTGRAPFANDTFNGQNQISRFATVQGYDLNGNLLATDARTYKYDAENRLTEAKTGVGATATTALTLSYDPTGRLLSTVAPGSAPTYFLYVGDELIGEYPSADISAPALRRYVHADAVDDPIAGYDETLGSNTRRWLHPDRQGSIVATSDESGAVTTYSYGPWGETGDWSSLRFRYTGQIALPEIQAYHYKARVYDPNLGRFLQTDPIGQQDDPNLYAYVRDDPTDLSDPTGLSFKTAFAKGLIDGFAGYGEGGPMSEVERRDFKSWAGYITGVAVGNFAATPPDAEGDPTETAMMQSAARMEVKAIAGQAKATAMGAARLPKPPTGPGAVPRSQRDPRRNFTAAERAAKREEQGGRCANGCGTNIDGSNSHGHHIVRHSDGGRTDDPANHAEVCIPCHVEIHTPDKK